MSVNFRYRVEIDGEDDIWMWHKDAAIAKADVASRTHPDGTRDVFFRVRKAQVVDEDTDTIIAEFVPSAE